MNRHRFLLRRAKVEARHLAGRRAEEAVQPELGTDGLVLWSAVRRLPDRQRAVLVLRYHEDLPEAEVALRTLKVVYQVDADPDAAAEVDGLAGRLLGTAHPIANAIKVQAHAPRPDCVDGRSMVLRRETDDSLVSGPYGTVAHFWWWARTTANLVPAPSGGAGGRVAGRVRPRRRGS